ncbi:MAG: NAD(P)-dependent alcohol dehydrogenase [Anaerolineae bacterium]|nr:NAD(P)-dependent alcohol dehydrogenase [Anaerolineae bacterium]
MKAILTTKYGSPDGLQLQEVARPIPADDEVLIRVHAATVTAGDVMLRKLTFPLSMVMQVMGIPRKKTPGHEFAGEIEAVGKDVTQFKKGDQVFGTTTGLRVGANAEYVCLPAEGKSGVMALKPVNLSFEESAAIPVGGMTALYLLKKARIQSGQKVLIVGASGSVGSYAVQLTKHFGADVTGVCSTANVDMVTSLGTDSVIDYIQEDFTQNGESYDIIFDAVGKISQSQCKDSLSGGGIFVSVQSTTKESIDNLLFLKELAEAGAIKPFIDRRYPLEQVAEAHQYVETGRKRGNVVINVVQNDR